MTLGRPANATPDQIAAMLRAGATSRQIIAALHVSPARVAQVRRTYKLPVIHPGRAPRTIAQTLTLYLQPYGDGHTRWTGPTTHGKPQMWAEGRRYHARGEIFRAHHGRTPDGPVRTTCTEPGCVAGPHLADRTILQAEQALDALTAAIFGTAA